MEHRTRAGTGKEIVKFIKGEKPMTKTVNPILSLAVVMALALAAVFGAMSLTGTAAANEHTGQAITGLEVTNVTANTVTLSWDFLEEHTAVDYRAQWTKMSGTVSRVSSEVDSAADDSTGFQITEVGDEDTKVVATIGVGAADTELPLVPGDPYTVYVQSRVGDVSGAYDDVPVTPKDTPVTGDVVITEVSVDDDKPGEVEISWTRGTHPAEGDTDTVSNWQYRVTPGTVSPDTGADTYSFDPDTPAPGADDWKDFMEAPERTDGVDETANNADDVYTGKVMGLVNKAYRFEVRARNGAAWPTADAPVGTSVLFPADAQTGNVNTATATAYMPVAVPFSTYGKATVMATPVETAVTLTWEKIPDATHFSVEAKYTTADGTTITDLSHEIKPIREAAEAVRKGKTYNSIRVFNLLGNVEYSFEVNLYKAADATGDDVSSSGVVKATPKAVVIMPVDPTFVADDLEPGKNSWYTLMFTIDKPFNGGIDTMTVKLEGFGVPTSIGTNNIALEVAEGRDTFTFNPATVAVDGKEITLTIPDVRPEQEVTKKDFAAGSDFRIVIYQGAGITNPTKANYYGGLKEAAHEDREIFVTFTGDGPDKIFLRASGAEETKGVYVPRLVQLSENDGGLETDVMAAALGFEKGVTVHFFVDKPQKVMDSDGNYVMNTAAAIKAYNATVGDDKGIPTMENDDGTKTARHYEMIGQTTTSYALAPNGMLDSGEDIVCSDVSSDTVASCEFKVSSPTFKQGFSYVNARDGDGKHSDNSINGDQEFELKPSITVTPEGGSPGEIMQVQLHSFPEGAVTAVLLHGTPICGSGSGKACGEFGTASVGSDGTSTLSVPIPNWAVAGVQELKVVASGEDDNTNVTIAGPRINPTPQTVVANQRISLVGTGFSPNSKLGESASAKGSKISISGYDIPWNKVNDGRDVDVDDGGNWSASVDLPLVDATTGSGIRKLRITDSGGRTGNVDLTLAERGFDITPPTGRVGTLAVIRGQGYPSKNDEGHSFTVDVTYKVGERSSTRVSVVPDASGRFEVQVRIPTTAAIPSTNQVEVSFTHEVGGTKITEVKQHMVPEGIIELSQTSGGPGSTVGLRGEGFKAFVPVESVKIGTIEITPAPKPSTDGNGMMEFDVLIPGLDVGIQTVEVKVGGTTSSTGFTVTESGVNPGDIKLTSAAIEELGENLVSVWHFNNDSKVWSFYDPTLEEGNTLTHMITGETYLIRIKSTVEVILNRDTRSLTCVGDNCWNQIVW